MYSGKIVLITGTSRGIGNYLAQCFLRKNAVVFGISRSEVEFNHRNFHYLKCDITINSEVVKAVRQIKERCGRLDILINNAGIASMNSSLLMPEHAAKKIMDVNFIGTFNMSRECAKLMIKNNYGRIVNFSTVAVPMCLEGEAIYSSSKAAVSEFSKVFAHEVARFNITVNVIGPSPILTDLIANIPKEKIQQLVEKMPIKRLGEFKDVENVVDFFVSDKSDYITGQTVYLGGVS